MKNEAARPAGALAPLPRKLRLFYGVGEFGQQFSVMSLSMFLLFFYTDVLKIDPKAAGVLLLIAKFWDAVNDPLMGAIIERSNGKHGKCRTFLLRWSVPAGVFFWLMFNAPDLSPTMKLVYAYVTYFGQDLCYTATGLAYTTLMARITSDPIQRVALNQSRAFISMFTAIFVSSMTMGLVESVGNGDYVVGFRVVMAVYAVLLTLGYIGVFLLTRGYDKQDVPTEEEKAEAASKAEKPHMPLGTMIKLLLQNNLWRWFVVTTLLYYGTSSITQGLLIYYVRDYIGNSDLVGLASLASMISGFFAIVLLKFFAQKMGKVRASIMGLGIAFTCMLVRVVSQDQIIPLYLACLLVAGFGLSLFASLVIPNIMDSIDYGEWKTGVRSDALVMSANSFGTKIGQGLGTASIAFMLDAMGYDETLAVQTESCVSGIHWLATLLPLIMYGVLIVLMLVIYRYEKKMPAIRAELAARREKAQ
ncbi:MAG TPA: glycoside-pentoside-hexuronide (GPH):cation symporter [Candidatus Ruthenibacterium merdigallinarum]|nr:glycoside-pentoside-hexuronide (GPH):cation symporter [Candidatus Ruthenibacterium merdigallinarum]